MYGALEQFKQWCFWREENGTKVPVDANGIKINPHDPYHLWTYQEIIQVQSPQGIAFVFTEQDPFFFIDLDNCLLPDGTGWNPEAMYVMSLFPGAFMEVSYSGNGLHIIGAWSQPIPHKCRVKLPAIEIELYTEKRFIALTGTNATGEAGTDHTAAVHSFIGKYLPSDGVVVDGELTDAPVEGWSGPTSDDELIRLALASRSASSTFGGGCSFQDLWECNVDRIANCFSDPKGQGAFDDSRADAALAQHLAFWTGKHGTRMQRLMMQSALYRTKWDRPDYIPRTIKKAVALQKEVFGTLPRLRATSEKQRTYADTVRSNVIKTATPEQMRVLSAKNGPAASAAFWLSCNGKTVDEIAESVKPVSTESQVFNDSVKMVTGYQYLPIDEQVKYFHGCVYVQDAHKIFTPGGDMLKQEQFNATYGGYVFQLDEIGDKTTRKAWEAFTESQAIRFPKVNSTYFRPSLEPGSIITDNKRLYVNSYVVISTARTPGDVSPFTEHLKRLLPNETDRLLLTSYLAACVQYKGTKFRWAPLIQGAEGNGKTLLTQCVAHAIGERYAHLPPASEISEKFNEWLFYKLLIGIEDIYVPDNKREVIEVLKPMITNERLAMRAMHQGQVMGDNVANFIINSNHKDAIRKHATDRRFAIFYTDQQTRGDINRSGMNGNYFPAIYKWLAVKGYSIVSDYLHTFAIPDEYNPATMCHRAPDTSSTKEAISSGQGGIEQEIIEAIEEGNQGFAGGWVSSVALDKLLIRLRAGRMIPPNKRRDLMRSIGYDWHPALRDGRLNTVSLIDDGKKPKLFIKDEHVDARLTKAPDVALAYEHAQTGKR